MLEPPLAAVTEDHLSLPRSNFVAERLRLGIQGLGGGLQRRELGLDVGDLFRLGGQHGLLRLELLIGIFADAMSAEMIDDGIESARKIR